MMEREDEDEMLFWMVLYGGTDESLYLDGAIDEVKRYQREGQLTNG
jgi:hypothetical protein